jgi:nucleotide-binding universal stress UspA family protein
VSVELPNHRVDSSRAAFSPIIHEDHAMFPPKTILLPTDYSGASESALALAHGLAESQRARLIGLNVIQPPNFSGEFNKPGPPPPALQHSLFRWLKQGCGPHSKVSVESRVLEGFAWEEIVRVAGESGCDLIVMGSEGKSGIGRTLLGSVAEQVARHAPCPVLIAKASAVPDPGPASGGGGRPIFSTILFPTDFSHRAGEAFAVASALSGRESRLVVQHVVPDAGQIPPEAESALVERLHTLYPAGSGRTVVYRLSSGNPAEEIRRAAEESHCDAIVMSSRGRTGIGRLLVGSVAESVFRNVPVPVVIVHDARPVPTSKPRANQV